jgi:hypothetical protein
MAYMDINGEFRLLMIFSWSPPPVGGRDFGPVKGFEFRAANAPETMVL